MASETIYTSTQNCKEFPGQKEIHNQTDRFGCQNSFSCSCVHHGESASEGTNGILCYSGSHLGQSLEANGDGLCSVRPIQSDILSGSGGDKCIHKLRNVANASENACLLGEHESCEASNMTESQEHKRKQNGSSLQDLYFQEYFDDEDDDDSDWEPVHHFVIQKWFCTNCTMPNFDDVNCCDVCGEPKESDVMRHDLFQSLTGRETQLSTGSDVVQRFQDSSLKACTSIGFDERMLLHSEVQMKSHPHPERPDRLRAIATSLANAGIFPGKCSLIPAREITQEELQMVHSLDHIEAVQQTSHMLCSYFTSDTYANEHSARAARLAAGLCADLACLIMSGHTRNGFALVRPPGHHAGIKQAMGFCLHNNAAIAALAAQSAGAKKVLIVDWDVHHGNGTQEIFDGNKSILYISLHRHEDGRFYPGTGAAEEVGIADAKGYSVNIPWNCGGVGDNDYIFAFQHIVLPIAMEFSPDITIISAGFDAARGDPLGGCDVTPAGYAQMAYMLTGLSQGKLLVILEGGYNLRSISSSATAVVKVLLGENPSCEMRDIIPSRAGLLTVLQVLKIQLKFWPILKENYTKLQSQWESVSSQIRRNQKKKRRRLIGPVWWKWGSRRFVYKLFYGHFSGKRRK